MHRQPTAPRHGSRSAATAHEAGAPWAWSFHLLARITNFATVRRHLGRARSDGLTQEFAGAIQAHADGARCTAIARDLIEVVANGVERTGLQQLIDLLEDYFADNCLVDGEPITIEVRIGASVSQVAKIDEVRLVEEAERALRDACEEGRAVVREVSPETLAVDRIALARDLPAAIADDQLFLQYQPKLHLRRQEIASVEALVRWRHPVHGLVLPNDFIPIAEESSDIAALTLWVIERVIADQRELATHGHDLRVFINIAGKLLADRRFVRRACALVEQAKTRVGFEITETSVIRDPESAIRNLKTFADIGIAIAIDDYGAGLSSLAYLKKLPASELKIDKLFVTQLTSSNRDPLIVRSTIDLAHALEMEVVAEGVETQASLALLAVMGCDLAQGFLISRPVELSALIAFLAEGHAAVTDPAALQISVRAGWRR